MAVDKDKAGALEENMQKRGCFCYRIGTILRPSFRTIKIKG
jgi:hypothetical protein